MPIDNVRRVRSKSDLEPVSPPVDLHHEAPQDLRDEAYFKQSNEYHFLQTHYITAT